ncbi:MAG: YfjI family protein [Halomonas sp.]|uniref:YfjI family protein n=1 Tax=Halomonas sp. TaxID=1486246 RepID=UPI002ACE5B50|nr:YfjI family protein [Halomonas sp.]MDZ7852309.1 YfjI family protein [Halomonas sp.]
MDYMPSVLPPVGFCFPAFDNSGPLYEKIYQVRGATLAPIPIIVQGGLSVMSFLLQNLVDVEKPNGQIVPPSQYFVAVAASGERKDTVVNLFFETLDQLEEAYGEKYSREVEDYELDFALWIAQKKKLIKDIAYEKSDDVYALYEHERRKPIHPPRAGIKTLTDTTPEAALDVFHRESVKSAILRSSEGEEVLGGHAVRRLSLWNSLWSGQPVRVERKSTDSFIVNPRMTLFVQAQPSVMQRFVMKGGENARGIGFFARTHITFPETTQGSRPVEYIKEMTHEGYDLLVKELFEENIKASKDPDFTRAKISFSLPAKERWFIVANAIEWEIRPNGRFAGFGDHASKLADNIARLAVLLHCSRNGREGEVSLDTLEQAIKFCFWFSNEFLRLFQSSSEEYRDYYSLYNWFNQKRQEGFRYLKKNHVRKYCPNHLRDSGKLNIILNILMNNGEIRVGVFEKKTVIDLYPNYLDDLPLLTSVIHS